VLGGCGAVGGGGRMGSSTALLAARNDSSSEAVTRDAEEQRGRRRMSACVGERCGEESRCCCCEKEWHTAVMPIACYASMTMVHAPGAGGLHVWRGDRGSLGRQPLIAKPSPHLTVVVPHGCILSLSVC
jgi:hypothetical protein